MTLTSAISIGLGVTCGNFVFQLISRKRDWKEAIGNSFLQLVTVALCFGFSQK
jgi:hypothetical protein